LSTARPPICCPLTNARKLFSSDDELVGLRFRQPDVVLPGFELDLFIDKNDGLDGDALPLISRIIQ
jgi:hypothetical protein